MKKSTLIITAIIFMIAVSFAFITSDVPKYKNLKILNKNISEKELDSIMHFFSASLGKKCNFCHVRDEEEKSMDFVSDANPNKPIARKMMLMTGKINKKYFNYKEEREKEVTSSVTCYTCHHGQPHPEAKGKFQREDNRKLSVDSLRRGDRRDFPPDSSKTSLEDTIRREH